MIGRTRSSNASPSKMFRFIPIQSLLVTRISALGNTDARRITNLPEAWSKYVAIGGAASLIYARIPVNLLFQFFLFRQHALQWVLLVPGIPHENGSQDVGGLPVFMLPAQTFFNRQL